MSKGIISWKTRTAEGGKREVYAHHLGKEWKFYEREKRHDEWQDLPQPSLEDWLEVLDGTQRRIARRLMKPEEEQRIKNKIRELFPHWKEEENP